MVVKIKNATEFRRIMMKKGFSQRKLAKVANITDTTLSHILSRKRGCRPDTAEKILKVLDVDFDTLFIVEEETEPETE